MNIFICGIVLGFCKSGHIFAEDLSYSIRSDFVLCLWSKIVLYTIIVWTAHARSHRVLKNQSTFLNDYREVVKLIVNLQ